MKHSLLIALLTAGFHCVSYADTEPVIVDDNKILRSFAKDLGNLAEAESTVHTDALLPQLSRKSCTITLPEAPTEKLKNVYRSVTDSVVVIGSIYKCDKCPNWHTGSLATAWVLTSDGVMVTNYHVFKGKEAAGFGVYTLDGKVSPIVEILAASERDDVAIFRVKGEGFKPLAMGVDAGVGDSIHIIAHPDKRFYTYTAGNVSRYYRKPSRIGGRMDSMAVTAEFAGGSSGGPVVNGLGHVVGMVASTQSIYHPSKDKKRDPKGNFQMVIRNCVPVASIRKLIEK